MKLLSFYLGLHNFGGGSDWGGKFVGLTKSTWLKCFLELDSDHAIIEALKNLGAMELSNDTSDITESLPTVLKPLEVFVCKVSMQVYGDSSLRPNIADLRWKLFRTRNLEGENLPPTRPALYQHCLRVNAVCKRDKSYSENCPVLPVYTECGFKIVENRYMPVMTTQLPAPKAVLDFVKCGCKTGCKTKICSCVEAGNYCTPLCKCYEDDCENKERFTIEEEDIPEPGDIDEL